MKHGQDDWDLTLIPIPQLPPFFYLVHIFCVWAQTIRMVTKHLFTLKAKLEVKIVLDFLILLLIVVVVVLVAYVGYLLRERGLMKREIDVRAEKRLMEMKDQLRDEVLERSRATLKGRVAEQIVPFLIEFKYNPSDARFIGAPVDYVIFDGYTDLKDRKVDRGITVILADVKAGKSAALTPEQRRIRDAIEKKRVKWETIQLKG